MVGLDILKIVESKPKSSGSARSWWLALLALVLLARWPGLDPSPWVATVVVAGLVFLAKPRGGGWIPWLAVIIGLFSAFVGPAGVPEPDQLAGQFDVRVNELLDTAKGLTDDEELRRLFESSGEARDPARPFEILDLGVSGQIGRSAYLSDDRGRLLAWGGEERAYPVGIRPLGERKLGIVWSATGGTLYIREPILVEGRLVGAVTVAEWAGLKTASAWGMGAPFGAALILGRNAPNPELIRASAGSGIETFVGLSSGHERIRTSLHWCAWLVLAGVALWRRPQMSWAVVGAGIAAYVPGHEAGTVVGWAVIVLLAGAAVGRTGRVVASGWARMLVAMSIVVAAAIVLASRSDVMSPLPDHLMRPGWGGVWMVALAWTISGWPGLARNLVPRLDRKLILAFCLAIFGLLLSAIRVPIEIERATKPTEGVVLPREHINLNDELPASATVSRLDDLAPVLARRWGLDEWHTPSEIRLVGVDGLELSQWGDLSPAGDSVRLMQSWVLEDPGGATVELWVATEPWAWLYDWESGAALDEATARPVWFAALTRSGSVVASLHSRVDDLDAVTAGDLYHAGEGWTRIVVDGDPAIARVFRRDEWLVAAIGRYPAPAVWILKTAIASLWALFGLFVAWPPVLRREQLATFGGRLRLLVAGGVVLPLVILTLFLHLRLQREIHRMEQLVGLSSFASARYTADQLSGGFQVDNEIARWVSAGWGGEVVLFDGTVVVAVSRPDLLSTGVLPALPAVTAFQSYLIGRDDPVVFREERRVVAAGGVVLEGRRLLLQLIRLDPQLENAAPAAVDWLLTGALLAALLALILTSRIENRLSVSLRDLVQIARQLLHGNPLPEVRRPAESDLAEVLDAVRSMNQEVQRRETSLRSQEELLRITLATLAPAVVVLESSGEIRFANPSADQVRREHGDRLLEVVQQLAPGDVPDGQPLVETMQPVPGQELTWRVGVAGVPLPDGSRGLVAVIDDVTDVVRIDRLRQLNQLARIVAHEVKNPLTPIRLWVQELEEARRRNDPKREELVSEACREISLQVDRLQDTANSFSNLVALEHWNPEIIDLGELVRETLGGLTILHRRGIDLVPDLPDDIVCTVRADRQWLQRAVGNLVKNSVDAIGEDRGQIQVRVSCRQETTFLEVEDTAGGIPESQLQDLFSPHFSTTKVGSGLGLALVHQVVTRCQGRVSARNGDRGLMVGIELPRL